MRSQTPSAAAVFRHPFRARLVPVRSLRKADADDSDIKLFALSFTAFFVCFYTLIF